MLLVVSVEAKLHDDTWTLRALHLGLFWMVSRLMQFNVSFGLRPIRARFTAMPFLAVVFGHVVFLQWLGAQAASRQVLVRVVLLELVSG